jgi:hypothetical protein
MGLTREVSRVAAASYKLEHRDERERLRSPNAPKVELVRTRARPTSLPCRHATSRTSWAFNRNRKCRDCLRGNVEWGYLTARNGHKDAILADRLK